MRLTDKEKVAIVSEIKKRDSKSQVYLYGLRTEDDLKGGDIELLVISERIGFSQKIDLTIKNKHELESAPLFFRNNEKGSVSLDRATGYAVSLYQS